MLLTHSYRAAFPPATVARYRWLETRHAALIIATLAPDEFADITAVLDGFAVNVDGDIKKAGGNESDAAARLNEAFRSRGWREGNVRLELLAKTRLKAHGGHPATESEDLVVAPSYLIDNLKGQVAVDVEWHAKDGNLDRDIAAYRALYDAGALVAAAVITPHRGEMRRWAVEVIGERLPGGAKNTKFGTSTVTSIEKAEPKLHRGDGGGCPILIVGICRDTV